METSNIFENENHFIPSIEKSKFDNFHRWELGWAILEPINIASTKREEKVLIKQLSAGQKALYFFWYLDSQVRNGGFIQFYWNEYNKYLQSIRDGLILLKDIKMLELVGRADKEYIKHRKYFLEMKEKSNSESLYDNLSGFDELDETYYSIHHHTMDLFENYIRDNPDAFVKLK